MKLFRRILVPHDFSEHASRALRLATALARQHGGRLIVLHAITPVHPVSGLPEEGLSWFPDPELVSIERRRLAALVARTVAARDAPPVTCKVVIGDPFQRITEAARGADAIVMATAGRTGLSHLLIGSIAEKIVRHSPVPVLTLRPAAVRTTARTRRRTWRRRAARRAARRA